MTSDIVAVDNSAKNMTIDRNIFGMLLFIASESTFFIILILAYVHFHNQYGTGQEAAKLLNVMKTGIFSIALFSSSGTLWFAEKAHAKGQRGAANGWMIVTILLGTVFLVGQALEYAELLRNNVTISRDLFGTTFFTLTGFHGFHVFLGLMMLIMALAVMMRGKLHEISEVGLTSVGLYWHFVDAVWVVVFSVVYLWRYI